MRRILAISLSLLTLPASGWAICNDYDSCMNPPKGRYDGYDKDSNGKIIDHFEGEDPTEYQVLKAIAYKLSEIEEKLEPKDESWRKEWAKCYDTNCQTNSCPNGYGCYRTLPCEPCYNLIPTES